ncbi:signal recognition particle-docking protein FtsY [Corynebacterium macginleyi]|uniref:Signal recognition particle receptor FtsY n=1 Tax=Corynebacterium macginleyi TaxID=38290 RepID=A0A3M0GSP1_9CORY|nr:signal recognition particle-docking protein FtsY [Corynebacterium macginleyi]RMB64259.1 signal recognition particle-docking protein FtsY [Corynebacterium macginleyi]
MNSLWLWIGIAIVVIVLIVVFIAIGKKRGESKKVSFDKPKEEEPKQLTQEQKSGNYQAKSGFNFTPAGSQQPEKVAREEPRRAQPQQAKQQQFQKSGQSATEIANAQIDGEKPLAAQQEKSQRAEAAGDKPEGRGAAATAAADGAGVGGDVESAGSRAESAVNDEAVREPTGQVKDPAGQSDHEEKAPEPTASVEAAKVEDKSPVFDGLVEDKDADHIEERIDSHEEAAEAAAAANAQTDAAEAAKEQSPVPDGEPAVATHPTEDIAPAGGRLGRLRSRLSRSQNAIGQGLMGILSAGDLDEDAWEEIEDTLIMADLGTKSTMKVTDSLRDKIAERGVSSEEQARAMLRECLIEACHPEMDRSIRAMPNDGKPAIVMVVGVNGTGKTTTTGKLARVLVSMGHSVLLGAADTFRAAAADQLETWGRRVGAETVHGKEGADPASVAFDAVATGVKQQVDVVLVDTAGRLHTSTDLMDQLGKVKRVVEKKTEVDEVLLVLDATVGQNGLTQARIFREVVDISGVVLTKLDGTAKGGIVFQVQEELGVPVKLVGLGEGADDLAPFEVEGFVDALLGER